LSYKLINSIRLVARGVESILPVVVVWAKRFRKEEEREVMS
jgi:hypothetical protein